MKKTPHEREAHPHVEPDNLGARIMAQRQRHIDWAAQPLGLEPDVEIAERLAVTKEAVLQQRRKRGIVAYKPWSALVDFDDQPLGQMPDTELATRLDVSATVVARARRKRGIPGFAGDKVDWETLPLGRMTDVRLAEQLGVQASRVTSARLRRGIPSFTRGKLPVHVDWDAQPLGKVADRVLAERLGVSEWTVERHRRARGISPASPASLSLPPAACAALEHLLSLPDARAVIEQWLLTASTSRNTDTRPHTQRNKRQHRTACLRTNDHEEHPATRRRRQIRTTDRAQP